MERNVAADEFVNCVVRRGDQDLLLKPSLMIVSLLVPLMLGLLFAIAVIILDASTGSRYFPEDVLYECVLALMCTAVFTEAALVSFMIFCVTRRNRNHLKRDLVWMSSLCDYVDSRGGDSSRMREIASKYTIKSGRFSAFFSKAVWVLMVVVLIGLGIGYHYMQGFEEAVDLLLIAFTLGIFLAIILLAQFVVTVGSVFRFPSGHDKCQSDFTEELSEQLAAVGIDVKTMEHTVLRRRVWIHAILMILTLGIYAFIYLIFACRDMNKHMKAQWIYEEGLMSAIIEAEGGIDIEDTEVGTPSTVARIIRKLM